MSRSDSALKLKDFSPEVAKAERRRDLRHKVYMTDAIRIEITTNYGTVRGSLLDLSGEGLAFAVHDSAMWHRFQTNEEIEFRIASTNKVAEDYLTGVVLNTRIVTSDHSRFLRVGIKRTGNPATRLSRRRQTGFFAHPCPDFFRPLAFCADPLIFAETLHFQIDAWMPNGCVARTSIRNKSMFPGQIVPLVLLIPTQGEFTVDCRVIDVSIHSDSPQFIKVEFAFEDTVPKLLAAIGEFILTYNNGVNVKQLREEGFFLDTIFKALRVSYPTGLNDWEAVLNLRLKAYHSVNKMVDKQTPHDMADRFDAYSRQIVAKAGGAVVGAARVVFCGHDTQRSEHHAIGIDIPDWIVQKGFVEFSRFCTSPDWRGGDIFVALMQQASLLTWNAGAECIVANCNPDLWKIYSKLGFKKVSGPFVAFGRKDCYLIVCRPKQTIGFGIRSGFIHWNQILLPVHKFGVQTKFLRLLMTLNPWTAAQRISSPLLQRLRRTQKLRKFMRSSNFRRR